MKTKYSNRSPQVNHAMQQALQDFPYRDFKVFPSPYTEMAENLLDAAECTFDPVQLLREFFRKSRLQGHKNLWGWGIIDVEDDGENGITIKGQFEALNKEDWTKGSLYPEWKLFWGDYNPTTHQWSFRYGR